MFSTRKIMFSKNEFQFPPLVEKNLYVWGLNDQYQHGDHTNSPKNSPTIVGQWARISCGGKHCLALDVSGRAYGWGLNSKNQVRAAGLEDVAGFDEIVTEPTEVYNPPLPEVDGWLDISCGGEHNAAINIDRTLWGWGLNESGQGGAGGPIDFPNLPYPTRIALGSWIKVACGLEHSFAIRSDRTLWGWGNSTSGQVIGISNVFSPSAVSPDGLVFEVKDVSCGWFHTAAVKTDGSLWAWGRNDSGQLGNGVTNNATVGRSVPGMVGSDYGWSSVSCGSNHCVALKSDGTLWVWGRGTEGQLGLGSSVQGVTVPTKVGSDTWRKVSCGSYFTAAIKSDGTLWTWGHNIWDQLGLGPSYSSVNKVSSPTMVTSPGVLWDYISCSDSFMAGLGS